MDKVKTKKQKTKNIIEMPVVHPYAAGRDVSDKEHVVAVPEGLSPERVKTFGTMTGDLTALLEWLQHCEIDTVAMKSTGVYWKPLFSMLVRHGFEVYLAGASHVKNVTGRKTDENDALWIQKLHSCGLLKSSCLPGDEQEALRTLVRYRRTLVQDMSRFVHRMQKSLELMNIKFHTLISDITGQSGKAVIEAILNGERNAAHFLPCIGSRIKADRERIVKSLQGNWREEHLFTLKESYEMYKIYRLPIEVCDQEIEKQLQHYEAKRNEGLIAEAGPEQTKAMGTKKGKDKNHPRFDVRGYLHRICYCRHS